MQSNFQMLRSFKFRPKQRGWLTADEMTQIENHFKIKERSDVELQNLRDFLVLSYSGKIENEKDPDECFNLSDIMSGLTGVIDLEKANRGLSV